jgi:HD-GYP domain-containing protein (c-di-GMP phosphodiesterase class II)
LLRTLIHYTAAFIVLTLYGGQVCPFVESLTLVEWGASTAVLFSFFFIAHTFFARERITESNLFRLSGKTFKVTIASFILSSISIGTYNTLAHDFPVESGIKLFAGWVLVGYFAAIDLSLQKRTEIFSFIQKKSIKIDITDSYASLTKKFLIFATLSSALVLGVSFLVVIKDLDWLFSSDTTRDIAVTSILKEFMFIFSVILGYLIVIIKSFTKNLNMYLHYQNNALSEVTEGNFDAYVPVSSSDEFGIMAKYTNIMIESLKERTELLQQTQDVAILSLASLAETRDNETGAHIMRTQRYVYVLANYLKNDSDYEEALTEENIQLIYKSAPLHDIGKVGIPDNILLKPGRLTDEEFKIMKRHPNYGRKALNSAGKILGKNSFLKFAEEIAFTHHEKWDGSGYPRSLKGAEIPVSGRLMAVADVYDALISKRVYKDAFSHEKAKAIILESSGTHFDPKVVDAFINCESDFVKIAEDFSDEKYIDKVNKRKG